MSALSVPLGGHMLGDCAVVEVDDDRSVVLGIHLEVDGDAEAHLFPDEARALAAALTHFAAEAER